MEAQDDRLCSRPVLFKQGSAVMMILIVPRLTGQSLCGMQTYHYYSGSLNFFIISSNSVFHIPYRSI